MSGPPFRRYVALGDSTTEGLDDPDGQGGFRGWANRLAEKLEAAAPGVLYANLAIRGRVTREIRDHQLRPALALRPDFTTVVSGTNDLLRPRFDLRAMEADVGEMFSALVSQGATVLTFTLPDLSAVMPVARLVRGRLLEMNAMLRQTATRTGVVLVDLAAYPVTADARLWSDDRLHANSAGHARIAEALAQAAGLPADAGWSTPLPARPPPGVGAVLQAELAWTRRHLAPWVGRHLSGKSSGDGRVAKRPELTPLRSGRA